MCWRTIKNANAFECEEDKDEEEEEVRRQYYFSLLSFARRAYA